MFQALLCALCVASSVGALNVIFEKFELLHGLDDVSTDLRVRKFNRTTTTLNGTFTLRVNAGNEVVLSLDLFHSRLGNQQFNHYPMKLPTSGVCEFMDNVHENYGEIMAKIKNSVAKGECPVTPRTMVVLDLTFPTEMVPLVMPRGLWKAILTGKRAGEEVFGYSIVVKAYDDY